MNNRNPYKNAAIVAATILLTLVLTPLASKADVPTGSEDKARIYYARIASEIGFSTSNAIFQTKLDDVASYLGYGGLTGTDMQNLPSKVLMDPAQLLGSDVTNTSPLQHPDAFAASQGVLPFRAGDILVTRFFAPKIMNIKDPEPIRQWGWRKLVRLNSRPGSAAEGNHIAYGIILFNYFTPPGVAL